MPFSDYHIVFLVARTVLAFAARNLNFLHRRFDRLSREANQVCYNTS